MAPGVNPFGNPDRKRRGSGGTQPPGSGGATGTAGTPPRSATPPPSGAAATPPRSTGAGSRGGLSNSSGSNTGTPPRRRSLQKGDSGNSAERRRLGLTPSPDGRRQCSAPPALASASKAKSPAKAAANAESRVGKESRALADALASRPGTAASGSCTGKTTLLSPQDEDLSDSASQPLLPGESPSSTVASPPDMQHGISREKEPTECDQSGQADASATAVSRDVHGVVRRRRASLPEAPLVEPTVIHKSASSSAVVSDEGEKSPSPKDAQGPSPQKSVGERKHDFGSNPLSDIDKQADVKRDSPELQERPKAAIDPLEAFLLKKRKDNMGRPNIASVFSGVPRRLQFEEFTDMHLADPPASANVTRQSVTMEPGVVDSVQDEGKLKKDALGNSIADRWPHNPIKSVEECRERFAVGSRSKDDRVPCFGDPDSPATNVSSVQEPAATLVGRNTAEDHVPCFGDPDSPALHAEYPIEISPATIESCSPQSPSAVIPSTPDFGDFNLPSFGSGWLHAPAPIVESRSAPRICALLSPHFEDSGHMHELGGNCEGKSLGELEVARYENSDSVDEELNVLRCNPTDSDEEAASKPSSKSSLSDICLNGVAVATNSNDASLVLESPLQSIHAENNHVSGEERSASSENQDQDSPLQSIRVENDQVSGEERSASSGVADQESPLQSIHVENKVGGEERGVSSEDADQESPLQLILVEFDEVEGEERRASPEDADQNDVENDQAVGGHLHADCASRQVSDLRKEFGEELSERDAAAVAFHDELLSYDNELRNARTELNQCESQLEKNIADCWAAKRDYESAVSENAKNSMRIKQTSNEKEVAEEEFRERQTSYEAAIQELQTNGHELRQRLSSMEDMEMNLNMKDSELEACRKDLVASREDFQNAMEKLDVAEERRESQDLHEWFTRAREEALESEVQIKNRELRRVSEQLEDMQNRLAPTAEQTCIDGVSTHRGRDNEDEDEDALDHIGHHKVNATLGELSDEELQSDASGDVAESDASSGDDQLAPHDRKGGVAQLKAARMELAAARRTETELRDRNIELRRRSVLAARSEHAAVEEVAEWSSKQASVAKDAVRSEEQAHHVMGEEAEFARRASKDLSAASAQAEHLQQALEQAQVEKDGDMMDLRNELGCALHENEVQAQALRQRLRVAKRTEEAEILEMRTEVQEAREEESCQWQQLRATRRRLRTLEEEALHAEDTAEHEAEALASKSAESKALSIELRSVLSEHNFEVETLHHRIMNSEVQASDILTNFEAEAGTVENELALNLATEEDICKRCRDDLFHEERRASEVILDMDREIENLRNEVIIEQSYERKLQVAKLFSRMAIASWVGRAEALCAQTGEMQESQIASRYLQEATEAHRCNDRMLIDVTDQRQTIERLEQDLENVKNQLAADGDAHVQVREELSNALEREAHAHAKSSTETCLVRNELGEARARERELIHTCNNTEQRFLLQLTATSARAATSTAVWQSLLKSELQSSEQYRQIAAEIQDLQFRFNEVSNAERTARQAKHELANESEIQSQLLADTTKEAACLRMQVAEHIQENLALEDDVAEARVREEQIIEKSEAKARNASEELAGQLACMTVQRGLIVCELGAAQRSARDERAQVEALCHELTELQFQMHANSIEEGKLRQLECQLISEMESESNALVKMSVEEERIRLQVAKHVEEIHVLSGESEKARQRERTLIDCHSSALRDAHSEFVCQLACTTVAKSLGKASLACEVATVERLHHELEDLKLQLDAATADQKKSRQSEFCLEQNVESKGLALSEANNEVEQYSAQRARDTKELSILKNSLDETRSSLDAAFESICTIEAELAEERSVKTKHSSELKCVQDASAQAAAIARTSYLHVEGITETLHSQLQSETSIASAIQQQLDKVEYCSAEALASATVAGINSKYEMKLTNELAAEELLGEVMHLQQSENKVQEELGRKAEMLRDAQESVSVVEAAIEKLGSDESHALASKCAEAHDLQKELDCVRARLAQADESSSDMMNVWEEKSKECNHFEAHLATESCAARNLQKRLTAALDDRHIAVEAAAEAADKATDEALIVSALQRKANQAKIATEEQIQCARTDSEMHVAAVEASMATLRDELKNEHHALRVESAAAQSLQKSSTEHSEIAAHIRSALRVGQLHLDDLSGRTPDSPTADEDRTFAEADSEKLHTTDATKIFELCNLVQELKRNAEQESVSHATEVQVVKQELDDAKGAYATLRVKLHDEEASLRQSLQAEERSCCDEVNGVITRTPHEKTQTQALPDPHPQDGDGLENKCADLVKSNETLKKAFESEVEALAEEKAEARTLRQQLATEEHQGIRNYRVAEPTTVNHANRKSKATDCASRFGHDDSCIPQLGRMGTATSAKDFDNGSQTVVANSNGPWSTTPSGFEKSYIAHLQEELSQAQDEVRLQTRAARTAKEEAQREVQEAHWSKMEALLEASASNKTCSPVSPGTADLDLGTNLSKSQIFALAASMAHAMNGRSSSSAANKQGEIHPKAVPHLRSIEHIRPSRNGTSTHHFPHQALKSRRLRGAGTATPSSCATPADSADDLPADAIEKVKSKYVLTGCGDESFVQESSSQMCPRHKVAGDSKSAGGRQSNIFGDVVVRRATSEGSEIGYSASPCSPPEHTPEHTPEMTPRERSKGKSSKTAAAAAAAAAFELEAFAAANRVLAPDPLLQLHANTVGGGDSEVVWPLPWGPPPAFDDWSATNSARSTALSSPLSVATSGAENRTDRRNSETILASAGSRSASRSALPAASLQAALVAMQQAPSAPREPKFA